MAFLSSYSALFTSGLLDHCERAPLVASSSAHGPRRHSDNRRSSMPSTPSSSSKASTSTRSGRHSNHLRSFLSLDISESIRTRDSTVSMVDVRHELPSVDRSRLSTSFIHSPTQPVSRSTSLRSNASRTLPEAKPAPVTPPPPSPGAAVFRRHLPPSPLPPSPHSARPTAKPASFSLPSPKGSFDSLRSAPEFSPSTPFDFDISPTYSVFFPLSAMDDKSFSLNPLPSKSKSKYSSKSDSRWAEGDEDEKPASQLQSTLSFRSASTKPPITRSSTVTSSYRRTKRADALERLQGRHFKSFIGLDEDDEAEAAFEEALKHSAKQRRRQSRKAEVTRSQTPGNSPTASSYPHTLPAFNLDDLTLNLTEFEDWLDMEEALAS